MNILKFNSSETIDDIHSLEYLKEEYLIFVQGKNLTIYENTEAGLIFRSTIKVTDSDKKFRLYIHQAFNENFVFIIQDVVCDVILSYDKLPTGV